MSKKSLVFGVATMLVALFGAAVGISRAQSPLLGYVDWVEPVSPPETLVKTVLAAWAFDCATGHGVSSGSNVLFFVDGHVVPANVVGGYSRPDVKAAFVGSCPNVTEFSGYAIEFYASQGQHVVDGYVSTPAGTHFIGAHAVNVN